MKSGAFCLKIAQLYGYCRVKKENGRYPCLNLDKNAIRRADQCLYRAKQQGRNRVISLITDAMDCLT
ncbi:hypothetical protein HWI77_03760 [Acinetobacter venetianus]|uniref:hypothetical protein n=1 Tax=Acinetobacter venetianus TaxID=52133 RepID=UPI0010A6665C|nr:hypothetical protein [Acinetobacter venetianus]MCR4531509.1 hypothetical protein [Acinetobacter venetianus]MDA0697440.1 hypothetical protein [Pseudomonadota bacterium]MDA1254317.1 hypothetical protein [Pseudomonadota bacterium]QNH52888.1 hypothetical protein HWI77_03760 [Acinetobacter venetianus]